MHLQAVASAFLIVFLCQHEVLVSALLGGNSPLDLGGLKNQLNTGALTNQLNTGALTNQAGLGPLTDKIANMLEKKGQSPTDAVMISQGVKCSSMATPNLPPSQKVDEMKNLISKTSKLMEQNNMDSGLLAGLGNTVNNLLGNQSPQQGQAGLGPLTQEVSKLLHGQGQSTTDAQNISQLLQCVTNEGNVKSNGEITNMLSETRKFMEQNNIDSSLLAGLGNTVKNVLG